jgi:hypothetical protein
MPPSLGSFFSHPNVLRIYPRKSACKKFPIQIKEKKADAAENGYINRPRNPSANLLPSEGYVLEVDGKFKSEYETSEHAMKTGLRLKKKYPQIRVRVFDAKERTYTAVEFPASLVVQI